MFAVTVTGALSGGFAKGAVEEVEVAMAAERIWLRTVEWAPSAPTRMVPV